MHSRRLARALTEAYTQDGLLSFAELQWIFLLSIGSVSRAVDYYQRTHQVLLPCPGTVLDMGRMLTHKDVIVRLLRIPGDCGHRFRLIPARHSSPFRPPIPEHSGQAFRPIPATLGGPQQGR